MANCNPFSARKDAEFTCWENSVLREKFLVVCLSAHPALFSEPQPAIRSISTAFMRLCKSGRQTSIDKKATLKHCDKRYRRRRRGLP